MNGFEVSGMTRQAFLVRGALATGSAFGAAAVGPYVSRALAQEGGGGGDVEILNFALTLEFLEAEFYKQALQQASGLAGEAKELATLLAKHEAEHVDAITATIKKLGGRPVKAPGVDFGDTFESESSFLAVAQDFEDLGVAAYNGAAPDIQSTAILATAGSIVQVEARHAASIRQLRGEPITRAALEDPLGMEEVLDMAQPFLK